ncbi:MAG: sigma-70 family RNA polymerase sigma factor [Corallococcus sp.]|nr:sigma-70 family RNA polymerase sigma factor [Bacillota bacterium]MCM1533074.1 sigma-70 family RNA polymerase sigma factor [Corallococcus sp.]
MNKRRIDTLLIQISHGDNNAFAELYEGTKRGVFSFVYSYYKKYEDAEDAMQTAYLKIKLNINQYKHGTDGRAWILQIAKNIAINDINRNKRLVYTDDIEVRDDIKLPDGITDVMKRVLTEEELYIVNLHVLWGYKHREIAKELDCPTGTVTSKYKRSIEKLKIALKEGEQ